MTGSLSSPDREPASVSCAVAGTGDAAGVEVNFGGGIRLMPVFWVVGEPDLRVGDALIGFTGNCRAPLDGLNPIAPQTVK